MKKNIAGSEALHPVLHAAARCRTQVLHAAAMIIMILCLASCSQLDELAPGESGTATLAVNVPQPPAFGSAANSSPQLRGGAGLPAEGLHTHAAGVTNNPSAPGGGISPQLRGEVAAPTRATIDPANGKIAWQDGDHLQAIITYHHASGLKTTQAAAFEYDADPDNKPDTDDAAWKTVSGGWPVGTDVTHADMAIYYGYNPTTGARTDAAGNSSPQLRGGAGLPAEGLTTRADGDSPAPALPQPIYKGTATDVLPGQPFNITFGADAHLTAGINIRGLDRSKAYTLTASEALDPSSPSAVTTTTVTIPASELGSGDSPATEPVVYYAMLPANATKITGSIKADATGATATPFAIDLTPGQSPLGRMHTLMLNDDTGQTDPGSIEAERLAQRKKIAKPLLDFAEKIKDGKIRPNTDFDLTKDLGIVLKEGDVLDLTGIDWTPIGTDYSKPYNGTFNGGGIIIKGLTINNPEADYQGFFGYTGRGAKITDVHLTDVEVTGANYTGALVGYNYGGTITDCTATGNVTGKGNNTGALVGQNGGTITDCTATGNVTGKGNNTGALVGQNDGTITNCTAAGAVSGTGMYTGGLVGYNDGGTITACTATGSVSGTSYTGGLVGDNWGGTITACYATGSVTGSVFTGGLVGWNSYATITACTATGTVSGTDSSTGGLVGWNDGGTITACYATGSVTGTSNTGALVGYNSSSSTITACYATGAVTGTRSTGGLVGYNDGTTLYSNANGAVTRSGNPVAPNSTTDANAYLFGSGNGGTLTGNTAYTALASILGTLTNAGNGTAENPGIAWPTNVSAGIVNPTTGEVEVKTVTINSAIWQIKDGAIVIDWAAGHSEN